MRTALQALVVAAKFLMVLMGVVALMVVQLLAVVMAVASVAVTLLLMI